MNYDDNEVRRVAKFILGRIVFDATMEMRINEVGCGVCGHKLKQVRSGSMVAACLNCGAKFKLLKKVGPRKE